MVHGQGFLIKKNPSNGICYGSLKKIYKKYSCCMFKMASELALINSLKEMELSPLVSASWMVRSAMLPSWSSEMFTPTIIRKT